MALTFTSLHRVEKDSSSIILSLPPEKSFCGGIMQSPTHPTNSRPRCQEASPIEGSGSLFFPIAVSLEMDSPIYPSKEKKDASVLMRVAQRAYSSGCDKVDLHSAQRVLSLPRKEYCLLPCFKKEGNGMIVFSDADGREQYALFCTWVEGELSGSSLLYDIQRKAVVSVYTFCEGKLIGCEEVAIPCCDRCIVDACGGYRWEGPCYNGMLYEEVEEYNEDNSLVFRGYYFRDHRCGVGEEYYSFQQPSPVMMSRGYWCGDKLYGAVEVYDRNGDYVSDKTFIGDAEVDSAVVLSALPEPRLSTITEHLTVVDGVEMARSSVDLSDCVALQSLHIGDRCFTQARRFIIRQLPRLRTVEIGDNSFFHSYDDHGQPNPFRFKTRITAERRTAVIVDCPSLASFRCGGNSFGDYSILEMKGSFAPIASF